MRTLTHHERRTVRFGAAVIVIYLLLFGGFQAWNYLAKCRTDYAQLVSQADRLKQEVRLYDDRALVVKKLMESLHLDPANLSRTSVVAQASAAIQKAAMSGGIQVGPIRESPARPSSKELASVQLEGTGPVPAVMGLLNRLEGVGFPLIIDSVQLTPDMRPGQLKVNLTILILDHWTKEGAPHA
ncbi:MAG: hypothetical protein NT167_24775 [Verrucomicrobia bacterium]|nr:hypothetical protein [Verrucomicrobiota bacterium]